MNLQALSGARGALNFGIRLPVALRLFPGTRRALQVSGRCALSPDAFWPGLWCSGLDRKTYPLCKCVIGGGRRGGGGNSGPPRSYSTVVVIGHSAQCFASVPAADVGKCHFFLHRLAAK